MNRRNFFSTLVKGVGVFSILPPSETYSRIWKAAKPEPKLVWVNFSRHSFYCDPEYLKFIAAVEIKQAMQLDGIILK